MPKAASRRSRCAWAGRRRTLGRRRRAASTGSRRDRASSKPGRSRRPRRRWHRRLRGRRVESSRAALVFPTEIRSPILSFEKFDGGRVQAMPEKALVVLWASSCPTCAAELRALAAAKPQLDAAGIRVLALAIDGLGSTPGSPAEALAFLQQIRFPHGGGMATEETLEKFQVLHREFYYRPYHLPVPASFLVGSGGKLISVYRGEAAAAEVIAHFQAVEGGADREAAAAPYPGRWIRSERLYFSPANYFARLSDLGWIDDAAALAEDLWAGELPDATRLFVAHRCGADFLKAGRFPEAQRWFERALAIDPEHAQSLNNLGAVLQQSGDRFGAEASYRSASAADPAYAAPLQNLGVLLLKSGRADEAVGPLAKLVDLTPDDAEAWRTYGAALAEKGGFSDAEAAYRKALALEPDDAAAPIALAKISLLREDPAQAKAFLDQALVAERITPEQTAEVIRLSEAASK
ncbi:MAG: tetratricopeptide repeat protein [Verrucomicrobiales bacterium]